MAFLAWHIIAILTVMAVSFLIGYSLGKKEDRRNYNYIDRLKDSAALIRCGSELSRKALGQDNLNAAFALLIRNGFEVIDPTLSVIELDKIQGANND